MPWPIRCEKCQDTGWQWFNSYCYCDKGRAMYNESDSIFMKSTEHIKAEQEALKMMCSSAKTLNKMGWSEENIRGQIALAFDEVYEEVSPGN